MEVGISAAPSIAHDLYERYSGQIFGFCVSQLGSHEDAEDALQSTFLNAHRALQRGVTPDADLPWLFKIAHNVCLTRRRSTQRRGRIESPSDFEAVQDVVPAPARDARDELIELTDALAEMPDNQRRAILLREWKGLSYHEIADELELSQSAVETLIFRARRTLAANLQSTRGLFARAKHALDVGTLLAAAKTLFEGAVAVKATAAAVAVSGAVVVATAPSESPRPPVVETPRAKVVPAPSKPLARGATPQAPAAPAPRPTIRVEAPTRARALPTQPPAPATAEQPPAAAVPPPAVEAVTPGPAAPDQPAPVQTAPSLDPPRPAAAEPARKLRHHQPDRTPRVDAAPTPKVDAPTPKVDEAQPEPVAATPDAGANTDSAATTPVAPSG